MPWTKLPAVEHPGFRSGCLNCGPQPVTLPLDAYMSVGFGSCTVSEDGIGIYDEGQVSDLEDAPRLQKFEDMAKADPDHDWRCAFYGALSEAEYQRHGPENWVLIRKGEGFA